MELTKIENAEAIALVLIVSINHLLLNMPQSILNSCGSSSLLNTIYTFGLILIVSYVLLFVLFKNFSSFDILDVSRYIGGKKLEKIIGIICIVYLLSLSGIFIRNFAEGLKLIYFYKFPIEYILLFFLFTSGIANHFGAKSIIKSNLIIVPIVLLGLLILFGFSFSSYEPQRALPILGYGINQTFLTGATNIFAYNGLFFLFFLRPLIDIKSNFKKVTYISIVITGIFVFMAISSLLLSFPTVFSLQELSPIYYVIRNIHFGTFFQRPEALFILTWILGVMSYLNCVIFLVLHIFKKITCIRSSKNMAFSFICILFFVSLIPQSMSQIRIAEDVLYKYSSLIVTFLIFGSILAIANIKYKRNED